MMGRGQPAASASTTGRSKAWGGASSDSPISTVGLICCTASSKLWHGARSWWAAGGEG